MIGTFVGQLLIKSWIDTWFGKMQTNGMIKENTPHSSGKAKLDPRCWAPTNFLKVRCNKAIAVCLCWVYEIRKHIHIYKTPTRKTQKLTYGSPQNGIRPDLGMFRIPFYQNERSHIYRNIFRNQSHVSNGIFFQKTKRDNECLHTNNI